LNAADEGNPQMLSLNSDPLLRRHCSAQKALLLSQYEN
jgi:hypothetical protein